LRRLGDVNEKLKRLNVVLGMAILVVAVYNIWRTLRVVLFYPWLRVNPPSTWALANLIVFCLSVFAIVFLLFAVKGLGKQ